MKLKCPHCGNESETDVDLVDGQHVRCPFCNEKSVYDENADQPGDVVGAAAKAAIDAAKTAANVASNVGRKVYHRIQVEDWAADGRKVGEAAKAAIDAAKTAADSASNVGRKVYHRIQSEDWAVDRQKVGEAAARARKAVGDGYTKGNELMDKVPILKTKRAKLTVWVFASIVLLCFLRSCMSGGEECSDKSAGDDSHSVWTSSNIVPYDSKTLIDREGGRIVGVLGHRFGEHKQRGGEQEIYTYPNGKKFYSGNYTWDLERQIAMCGKVVLAYNERGKLWCVTLSHEIPQPLPTEKLRLLVAVMKEHLSSEFGILFPESSSNGFLDLEGANGDKDVSFTLGMKKDKQYDRVTAVSFSIVYTPLMNE